METTGMKNGVSRVKNGRNDIKMEEISFFLEKVFHHLKKITCNKYFIKTFQKARLQASIDDLSYTLRRKMEERGRKMEENRRKSNKTY